VSVLLIQTHEEELLLIALQKALREGKEAGCRVRCRV